MLQERCHPGHFDDFLNRILLEDHELNATIGRCLFFGLFLLARFKWDQQLGRTIALERHTVCIDAILDEAIADGLCTVVRKLEVLLGITGCIGVALNLDLLDLRVVFENLGDFFEQAVGLFLNCRLVQVEEDLLIDLDLFGRHDDALHLAALVIITLLSRAFIETLAAEVAVEVLFVNPWIAVTVAIGIGCRATAELLVTLEVRAHISLGANILILIECVLVGNPRIAHTVAIIVGIRATVCIFEAVHIFAVTGASVDVAANAGIFLTIAAIRNPRIAIAVSIRIGIRATIVCSATGQFRTFIDACANLGKHITVIRNPGLAIAVTIGIRIRASTPSSSLSPITIFGVAYEPNLKPTATFGPAWLSLSTSISSFKSLRPAYVSLPGFSRPNSL